MLPSHLAVAKPQRKSLGKLGCVIVADEMSYRSDLNKMRNQRHSGRCSTRSEQGVGKQMYIPRRLNARLERTGHGEMVASDGATRLPSGLVLRSTHACAHALAHAARPINRNTSWQKEALSIGESESCGGSGA